MAIGPALRASGVLGYLDQPWVAPAQLVMGAAVAIRRIAPFTGAVVISLAPEPSATLTGGLGQTPRGLTLCVRR